MSAVAALLLLAPQAVTVRLVVDEPRQVLAMLDARARGETPTNKQWDALFATEGYRRLKDRELGMKREFTEEAFKKFVLSDELLAKKDALKTTLERWEKVDMAKCGERSLLYLPKGATIKAKVYPLIKPRTNSFVWDTETNPAIMLYLDPETSPEELAATVAHELHHVGYSTVCPSAEYKAWVEKLPDPRKRAMLWVRAFGEGFAMLAQNGGPRENPCADFHGEVPAAFVSGLADEKARFEQLASFFYDVLDGKLDEDKAAAKAMEFYGMVGPWYTVGYRMASVIEEAFGRERLLACYLDPRLLMGTYQDAAKKAGKAPLWPEGLVARLG